MIIHCLASGKKAIEIKSIIIDITDECADLRIEKGITELDCILSILTIYDRLSPRAKEIAVKHLSEFKNKEANELLLKER